MKDPNRPGRPRARKGPRPEIAKALIAARTRRGLSQIEAARLLQVDPTTLAKWESGSLTPRPMAEKLIRLWTDERLDGEERGR